MTQPTDSDRVLPPGYYVREDILHRFVQAGADSELRMVCGGWFTITGRYRAMDGKVSYLVEGGERGTRFLRLLPAQALLDGARLREELAARFIFVQREQHKELRAYAEALTDFALTLPRVNWFGARPTRELCAYHEAAHAVMSWHHGGSVGRLRARATGGEAWTGDVYGSDDARVYLVALAVEEEWMRRRGFDAPDAWRLHKHLSRDCDYAQALRILGTPVEVERCYAEVRRFVRENWDAFETAGRWLMQRPAPSIHQVEELRRHVTRHLPTVAPRVAPWRQRA